MTAVSQQSLSPNFEVVDDLQYDEGMREELFGHIQKRTGETHETVEKAVKEAYSGVGCGCSCK